MRKLILIWLKNKESNSFLLNNVFEALFSIFLNAHSFLVLLFKTLTFLLFFCVLIARITIIAKRFIEPNALLKNVI